MAPEPPPRPELDLLLLESHSQFQIILASDSVVVHGQTAKVTVLWISFTLLQEDFIDHAYSKILFNSLTLTYGDNLHCKVDSKQPHLIGSGVCGISVEAFHALVLKGQFGILATEAFFLWSSKLCPVGIAWLNCLLKDSKSSNSWTSPLTISTTPYWFGSSKYM
ncbi:hypothetical protein WICPIJ_002998 [Wickerhamomyces pijperi]|uniref:Uncharacterized protein n=1 Tax=Wickerhamomyces pijperi TaxID=599730 RepID=A0A9P8TPA0_WICPI|nr:hypothetical protein WICPIJ_002998 [Wickerhamomyces pijperi]